MISTKGTSRMCWNCGGADDNHDIRVMFKSNGYSQSMILCSLCQAKIGEELSYGHRQATRNHRSGAGSISDPAPVRD